MTGKRSIVGFLGAGLLILGTTACGGDDGNDASDDSPVVTTAADTGGAATTTGAATGGTVAVTIQGFAFKAEPVTAGQPFEVENKDTTAHTFTSDDGKFDVKVAAGSTASVDGLDAGSYPFHCTIHPTMKGTLDVG